MSRFFKNHPHYLFLFLLPFLLNACKSKQEEQVATEEITVPPPPIVDVTTRSMEFEVVDTILSGWNTFAYHNLSKETHFFVLEKYPDSVTVENTKAEIGPVFDEAMELLNQGQTEEGFAVFSKLPQWFFSVVFSGGSGLISPGLTSISTVNLEPGYYVMECYVKMPNGQFHSSMGMTRSLIVREESSMDNPPIEAIPITISSTEGITGPDAVAKGTQTFSVTFTDQKAYENFVGHDVNLVRISPGADLKVLEAWMNWADPKGLITPAPEGFIFLGGMNDSPAGSTGYFSAELHPGTYALISETPMASQKGLLKTFTVAE